jgi:DNA-binding NarL/FixJ family response regulator
LCPGNIVKVPAIEGSIFLAKPTVLVADDSVMVFARVLSCLKSHFEVIGTASNGRDLIAEAERLHPDVVVLDITMPELNGIEAAHELRQRGAVAKLVFLTVHTTPAFVDACFEEGALGYVTKSRLGTDLVPAINEALIGHKFVSPGLVRQEKEAQHGGA